MTGLTQRERDLHRNENREESLGQLGEICQRFQGLSLIRNSPNTS